MDSCVFIDQQCYKMHEVAIFYMDIYEYSHNLLAISTRNTKKYIRITLNTSCSKITCILSENKNIELKSSFFLFAGFKNQQQFVIITSTTLQGDEVLV